MIGKRLINTGVAAADALVPSENFNTVLYTGNGSTQRIGGYINRGGVFNGSSSKIVTSLNNSDIESFSFWFYFESGTTIGRALGSNVSSSGGDLSVEVATNGTIVCQLQNLQYATSTGALGSTGWKHIYYDTNRDLYINGTLNSSGTDSTTSFPSSTALIGALRTNYGFINTKIDQVRFFNKTLSSSEVTTLYGETHASTTISTTDIFSDNSGVALYQLDGNANDTGGVSGKFGSAAHFNGSSSQIDLNYASLGMGVNNFSYSFWFKLNSTSGVQTFFQVLSEHINYGLRINDTYNLQSSPTNSSGGAEYIGSNVTLDTNWHHVAYVKSSTNGHSLWYDGTKVAEDTNFTGNVQATTTNKTTLGSATNDINWLNGFLDDVRFYSDELTSTEIGYLYNNTTASIPTDNLKAYYKLDGDARDEQQLYDGTATNVTYAYDGTATNVTYQEATSFTPDLVWIKNRDAADNHMLYDVIRGATKTINSSTLGAESTHSDALTSFDSNGFTVGSKDHVNASGEDIVAWCFKGGGTAVSNTDGSITSSVSANQDAGFSICSYTATNSTQNVGHGLSATPELVIIKRTSSPDYDWIVYTNVIDSSVDYLILNSTTAKADTTKTLNSTVFTTPTTGDFVAYSFHSVDGYSKIGSYTGNGSTSGPIVETGFEPAWIMIKATNLDRNWVILDNKRGYGNNLSANTSLAEYLTSNGQGMETQFLSNGFQIETTSSWINNNNTNYIYLAIAADPDTTTPTVENSFDVVTYQGNGGTQDIETDFKPDLIWVKNRNNSSNSTHDHSLFDSIRGTFRVRSNSTGAQNDYASHFGGINENGFTVTSGLALNDSAGTYVAYAWKAGDHDDNLPQINTEGSIDSIVSVNAEAGFSIVKYTTPTTNNFSVGHGLSSAPELVFFKGLNQADNWITYASTTGATKYLRLNGTDEATTSSLPFNDTSPTSTVINLGSASTFWGTSIDTIAYCFHSVSGYQKIGTYSGTGSSNSITGVGFQPRFVLIKRTDSANGWNIFDSVRGAGLVLFPHTSGAELDNTANFISFDSDGFSLASSGGDTNASGGTYIYLAIK